VIESPGQSAADGGAAGTAGPRLATIAASAAASTSPPAAIAHNLRRGGDGALSSGSTGALSR
jgi:hypothetical protein